jgi:hypothetical protein
MTMWVSVGASPTDPTSNELPDVDDLEAGSMGEELRATRFWESSCQPLLC